MPDQVFLTRKPPSGGGGPDERRHADSPRAELRRRLRETGGRGRKLRGLAQLLAPYRWRVMAMFVSLVAATAAALAPAPLAKLAIDQGIEPPRHRRARRRRGRVPVSAVVYAVATYAQTYLVGLGRPARAPGSAAEAVRPPAVAVDRVLLAQPGGRDHLPHDQRRRGARPAGRGRPGHADPVQPDPDRRGGDPAGAGLPPGAADLPRAADPGRRGAGLPDRLGRRLPAHAGEDRLHHRLPAGDPVGDPRRPRVRTGAAPHRRASRSSTTRTAAPT